MKVLVVSNMYPSNEYPSYGVFVKNFCNQLVELNVLFDKVVMQKSSDKINKCFRYLFFYINSFIKCLFGNYDIIYIHYASHSSIGILLASNFKKLNIYTNLHGSDVFPENNNQNKMQKYTRKILRISKRVIVPSMYFKKEVNKKYGISNNNIFIYPSGGVNKKVFYKRSSDDVKKEKIQYGVKNSLYTFGMAGRITKDKGWDIFLESIRKVLDDGFNANFIIVGDGNESAQLKNMIQILSLENNVIFMQQLISQDCLGDYYSMLDYFIFPTQRNGESLGLVAIESMACGTPVIASDFAAPKYYIKNGINGFQFKKGNSVSLANQIINIIKNSISKEKFEEGLNETVEQFDSKNTRLILKEILSGDKI